MAGLFDFLSLLVTATIFVGIIVGVVYIVQRIQRVVNNTKESLKKKGLVITESGVSVKTDKHFDREDYVDATQRGFIKAMGATSFGTVDEKGNHVQGATSSPSISRHSSSNHVSGSGAHVDEKKSLFGLRKTNSGTK